MLDEPVRHGGHGAPVGDPLPLDEPEHLVHVERTPVHHHRAAGRELGHHQIVQTGDVEERQRQQMAARGGGRSAVLLRARVAERVEVHHGQEIAVRVHRALRQARGAAGVEDDGRVVLGHVAGRQRGLRVFPGEERHVRLDAQHGHPRIVDQRGPLGVRDHHRGPDMSDAVGQFTPRPPGVEAHRDGPDGHRGPERHDPLGRVGRRDGHPVALAHSVIRTQRLGQRRDQRGMPREGQPLVRGDHVVALTVAQRVGEQFVQRSATVLEHRHPGAENLLVDEFERFARSGGTGCWGGRNRMLIRRPGHGTSLPR